MKSQSEGIGKIGKKARDQNFESREHQNKLAAFSAMDRKLSGNRLVTSYLKVFQVHSEADISVVFLENDSNSFNLGRFACSVTVPQARRRVYDDSQTY